VLEPYVGGQWTEQRDAAAEENRDARDNEGAVLSPASKKRWIVTPPSI
jgi:hypothetical protein